MIPIPGLGENNKVILSNPPPDTVFNPQIINLLSEEGIYIDYVAPPNNLTLKICESVTIVCSSFIPSGNAFFNPIGCIITISSQDAEILLGEGIMLCGQKINQKGIRELIRKLKKPKCNMSHITASCTLIHELIHAKQDLNRRLCEFEGEAYESGLECVREAYARCCNFFNQNKNSELCEDIIATINDMLKIKLFINCLCNFPAVDEQVCKRCMKNNYIGENIVLCLSYCRDRLGQISNNCNWIFQQGLSNLSLIHI